MGGGKAVWVQGPSLPPFRLFGSAKPAKVPDGHSTTKEFRQPMHRLFSIWLAISMTCWAAAECHAMAPRAPGEKGADPTFQFFMMIGMIVLIFYFIVIRPQQKEQKRHQRRIDELKKGDRVVTSGGMHGTVRATKEKTLVLEIAEGVKVTLNKQSVSTVLEDEGAKSKRSGRESAEDEAEEE